MNTEIPLYTNEASPEFLRSLDEPHYTEQQLADFDEQALAIIYQQQAYKENHPAIAIYRVATEGSQTRNGGVIQHATAPLKLVLDNGRQVRVAKKGDHVVYADGSTAQIVTASREDKNRAALVGDHLSNGDEIINTPQGRVLLVAREGVPIIDDLLPTVEG